MPPVPAPLLTGKLALVTGAASGIGQAISVAFAAAGARVLATDRSAEACARTLELASAFGTQCRAFALDVTDAAAVQALSDRIGAEIGDIDVLVNNAGIIIRQPVDAGDAAQNARRMMDVNYFGALNTIQAWLPALRRTRGNIINVASGAALHGQRGAAAYSASKGALKLLTQSLAGDFARDGIRVNALAPGVIETPMTEATRNDPQRLEGFLARIPARRLGQPHEIAAPAVFLASDMASYVDGVVLSVDGGLTAC
ncbi:SDR family NAD(P)-dependent oxidoreductase [Ramlibacter sp. AN1133]|uniref:SDR family NAD(P)-dependent oxidoreductase n=1 Tax=Ramlibacter sp. AN1133 TaxID=3133429 RepID=UPI0030C14C1F